MYFFICLHNEMKVDRRKIGVITRKFASGTSSGTSKMQKNGFFRPLETLINQGFKKVIQVVQVFLTC